MVSKPEKIDVRRVRRLVVDLFQSTTGCTGNMGDVLSAIYQRMGADNRKTLLQLLSSNQREVIMKSKSVIAAIFIVLLLSTPLIAADATLRWDASSSAITDPDLTYMICQRTEATGYNYAAPVWTGTGLTATVQYTEASYFCVFAVDSDGRISPASNEVFVADPPPASPQNAQRVASSVN